MGYILPITNGQVVQYSNRTSLEKKEPIKRFPDYHLRIEPLRNDRQPSQFHKPLPRKLYDRNNDGGSIEILAELTGKGQYFNESI